MDWKGQALIMLHKRWYLLSGPKRSKNSSWDQRFRTSNCLAYQQKNGRKTALHPSPDAVPWIQSFLLSQTQLLCQEKWLDNFHRLLRAALEKTSYKKDGVILPSSVSAIEINPWKKVRHALRANRREKQRERERARVCVCVWASANSTFEIIRQERRNTFAIHIPAKVLSVRIHPLLIHESTVTARCRVLLVKKLDRREGLRQQNSKTVLDSYAMTTHLIPSDEQDPLRKRNLLSYDREDTSTEPSERTRPTSTTNQNISHYSKWNGTINKCRRLRSGKCL